MDILILVGSLVLILAAAELFTNGVEWLGARWNLSQGAVGSVLAAVGTALPETIVPMVAILAGSEAARVDIGLGAILGAPFMLGTLAFLVTGLAVIYFSRRQRRTAAILVDQAVIRRDLAFFLAVYSVAVASSYFPLRWAKQVVAALLLAAYVLYVYQSVVRKTSVVDADGLKPLFLARGHDRPPLPLIGLQVAAALGMMVTGAHLFVDVIEHLALKLGISPFLISVVVAPIATELPEKFNSVLWVGQGKDTLALGNITGAMVFQGSVIPAIGIFLTPWSLGPSQVLTGLLALASAAMVFMALLSRGSLRPRHLCSGALFYLVYLVMVL